MAERLKPDVSGRDRRCQQCREIKPLAGNFRPSHKKHSGFVGVCKDCEDSDRKRLLAELGLTEHQVMRMCERKYRHGSKDSALASAIKRSRHTPTIRVYPCPVCDGFHLTSQDDPDKEQ